MTARNGFGHLRLMGLTMIMAAAMVSHMAHGMGTGEEVQLAQGTPSADAQISRETEGDGIGRGAVTNLPVPRYVSLKGGEGNVRRGPSLSHRIDWVFRHAGMPLRVTAEFGHWRRVEDKDGAGGWVHYALLSGVRSVLITTDMAELRDAPRADARVSAQAELGVVARIMKCEPDWCRVSTGGERGWITKTALWGVEPGEIID